MTDSTNYSFFRQLQQIAFFVMCVFIISIAIGTTKSFALDIRCDSDFWEIQKTDAKSRVVVDTAQTSVLTKQSDSTLIQTCFDQAMVKSGVAGSIFSDDAGGSGFTILGAAANLGGGGGGAQMLGLVTNFQTTGASPGTRGSSLLENMNDTVTDAFTGLLDDFSGSLTGAFAGSINTYLSGSFSALFGGGGGVFGTLLSNLLSSQSSEPFDCGLGDPSSMITNWKDKIIGQGLSADVIDMDEILVYAALGILPPKGLRPAFKIKIDNWQNKEILRTAYHNNKVNLPVNNSPLKFVKSIPALTYDSTLEEVIRSMDEIEEKPGLIPLPIMSSGISSNYMSN